MCTHILLPAKDCKSQVLVKVFLEHIKVFGFPDQVRRKGQALLFIPTNDHGNFVEISCLNKVHGVFRDIGVLREIVNDRFQGVRKAQELTFE